MKKLQWIAAGFVFLGLQTLQAQEDEKPVTVEIGKEAPDFTLKGEKNQSVSLSDYKGKNVILIFSRGHT